MGFLTMSPLQIVSRISRALTMLICLVHSTGCNQLSQPGSPINGQGHTKNESSAEEKNTSGHQTVETVTEPVITEVGKRAQNYKGETGLVVTPIRALMRTEEKVIFEIQIPHAMQLYKALQGNAPRTEEEFMQHIIGANKIHLPELPAGHKYEYDPEGEQLMVRRNP